MDQVETVGDAVAGGLIGRSVEPGAGEATESRAGRCANCGAALTGRYCQECGQAAHLHRNVASLGHELLHGILHFEGKIWRTLPMLAWRPGELTRRYIAGERARFVSPLALFLFSVFLMFAVVSSLPGSFAADLGGNARGRIVAAQDDVKKQIKMVEGARTRAIEQGRGAGRYDRKLADLRTDLAELRRVEPMLGAGPQVSVTAAGRRVAGESAGGKGWLDARWRHAKQNPELLIYKLKNSAYKFSWALIPISLPFIWLLFAFRRDVGIYDHAIFAIYSLSFMSLLAILVGVLASLGLTKPAGLLALGVPPVHMYRQLKGAYRLSRLGALWRTVALLAITGVTSTIFILLLAVLGSG